MLKLLIKIRLNTTVFWKPCLSRPATRSTSYPHMIPTHPSPVEIWSQFHWSHYFSMQIQSSCTSQSIASKEALDPEKMCNNCRSTTSERNQAQPHPQEQCRSHIFTTHSNQMTCIVTSGSLLSTEPSWARTTYHSKVLPRRVDKISTATTRYMC